MKSNEEFIAGIYEKAANYVEKDKKTEVPAWRMPALRIAAAVAVCIGLAGMGALVLRHGSRAGVGQPGNDGIALLSETSEENEQSIGLVNYRMLPEQEEMQLTGTVESIDKGERVLWVLLESWGKAAEALEAEAVQGTLAAIQWNMEESIPAEIAVGTKLMAAGEVGTYGNMDSERFGMTQLTLTDIAKLWIWIEKESNYKKYNSEEQE